MSVPHGDANGSHQPRRGDDVEVWLKRMRDTRFNANVYAHRAVDALLDRYRECSDYGLSLRPEDDEAGEVTHHRGTT